MTELGPQSKFEENELLKLQTIRIIANILANMLALEGTSLVIQLVSWNFQRFRVLKELYKRQ